MGQVLCKDCCLYSHDGPSKKNAVTWGESTEDIFTDATMSLHSSPSRSKRINNKKRSVALHAEYRVHHHEREMLAPPLCCETIMEATDNVFAGQDLGVDIMQNEYSSRGSTTTIVSSGDSSNEVSSPSRTVQKQPPRIDHPIYIKHEKTPEEDAFLDEALSEEDNIVFEMIPEHLRQTLKDHLEQIAVPKNTLLIKKGNEPDYLYLILDGEVSVYIDPEEYMDENAMDIGKNAPIDISLSTKRTSSTATLSSTGTANTTVKREFQQSYVLNLRKSLFGSTYNENNNTRNSHNNDGMGNILGRVFNLGQNESRISDVSKNTVLGALLEENASGNNSANEGDEENSFNLYKDLKGLKHERDLGPQDGKTTTLIHSAKTCSSTYVQIYSLPQSVRGTRTYI